MSHTPLYLQICSKCKNPFQNPQKIYSLKVCRVCNNGNGMLWNRDVNAARNIRDIYIFMCENGRERPSQFVRS